MSKRKMTVMAAVVLMGVVTGAMAREPAPDEIRIEQQTVRYDDLDLRTTSGVAMLHWRLRVAAGNVCVQESGPDGRHQQRQCRSKAIERAMAAVPATVSTYHTEWKAAGAHWLAQPQTPAPTQLAATR